MQIEAAKYLHDIAQACDRLARFTVGKGLADYEADEMLRSAVERQFEIIGEALNQMLRLEPGLASQISNAAQIIAFRNLLAHRYRTVANKTVWGVLEDDLPLLRQEVEVLLRSVTDEEREAEDAVEGNGGNTEAQTQ
jgi:uncharacterized protein with HEPN domain